MWLSLGYNIWNEKNRVKSGDSDIIDIGLWFVKPTKYASNYAHVLARTHTRTHTHTHTHTWMLMRWHLLSPPPLSFFLCIFPRLTPHFQQVKLHPSERGETKKLQSGKIKKNGSPPTPTHTYTVHCPLHIPNCPYYNRTGHCIPLVTVCISHHYHHLPHPHVISTKAGTLFTSPWHL